MRGSAAQTGWVIRTENWRKLLIRHGMKEVLHMFWTHHCIYESLFSCIMRLPRRHVGGSQNTGNTATGRVSGLSFGTSQTRTPQRENSWCYCEILLIWFCWTGFHADISVSRCSWQEKTVYFTFVLSLFIIGVKYVSMSGMSESLLIATWTNNPSYSAMLRSWKVWWFSMLTNLKDFTHSFESYLIGCVSVNAESVASISSSC